MEERGRLPEGTMKNRECLGVERMREGISGRGEAMSKSIKAEKQKI